MRVFKGDKGCMYMRGIKSKMQILVTICNKQKSFNCGFCRDEEVERERMEVSCERNRVEFISMYEYIMTLLPHMINICKKTIGKNTSSFRVSNYSTMHRIPH